MATKRPSKRTAPKPKRGGDMSIMVGCCSQALDIVFVNDSAFSSESGGYVSNAPTVRIKHPTKKFQILGLAEATVNKGTTPWQIYVVAGNDPTPLTAAVSRRPGKKK